MFVHSAKALHDKLCGASMWCHEVSGLYSVTVLYCDRSRTTAGGAGASLAVPAALKQELLEGW